MGGKWQCRVPYQAQKFQDLTVADAPEKNIALWIKLLLLPRMKRNQAQQEAVEDRAMLIKYNKRGRGTRRYTMKRRESYEELSIVLSSALILHPSPSPL